MRPTFQKKLQFIKHQWKKVMPDFAFPEVGLFALNGVNTVYISLRAITNHVFSCPVYHTKINRSGHEHTSHAHVNASNSVISPIYSTPCQ